MVNHPDDNNQGLETLFNMVAKCLNRKLNQAKEKLDVLRVNVNGTKYGDRSVRDHARDQPINGFVYAINQRNSYHLDELGGDED